MSPSLEIQLREAWQLAADKFASAEGPLVRTSAAVGPAELQASWAQCVASVRALFAGHFGQAAIDLRFHVPDDYATFMQVIGGGWKWPHSLEWSLFDAESVAGVTAQDFRLFVTGAEEDEPVLDSGFWLGIGWWSDKHEYLLCCDRAHGHYGVVLDGHDSHPWTNGVEYGGCYPMARSFLEWLRRHARA